MALFNEKQLEEKEQPKKNRAIKFNEKEIQLENRPKSNPVKKPVKKDIIKPVQPPVQPIKKKINKTKTLKEEKALLQSKDDNGKSIKKKKNPKLLSFLNKKSKNAPPSVKRKIAEIMSTVDMTESGVFEMKEEYLEILQIESDDMYSKNEEEKTFIIYNHAYFYQAYQHAIKIVSLNFPCETGRQQLSTQRKLDKCSNPLYEKFLVQKLKELRFLEWGRTNREYYLFVYGKNESVVKDRVQAAKRYLQRSTALLDVDEDKKLEIMFKLHNQNSKLGSRNL
ncbi:hypothetical protein BC30048_p2072 (plasmid) [Bacillus cereus]|uniref:hypothetical protein n=1 Tax=Bacillus cereus TaxID=1396 RepID=UPI001F4490BA|nr:hypothetical protein [Bacillus cereus]BCC15059.1 hypothetical protein BCM0074_p1063 [Bacillus cereus]BCD02897.1 hypothetical protein BC30048_p2072 [Bacillus cereus]HDR6319026.1 hypothetical protein [Bacillus thuringiensis]